MNWVHSWGEERDLNGKWKMENGKSSFSEMDICRVFIRVFVAKSMKQVYAEMEITAFYMENSKWKMVLRKDYCKVVIRVFVAKSMKQVCAEMVIIAFYLENSKWKMV